MEEVIEFIVLRLDGVNNKEEKKKGVAHLVENLSTLR